MRVINPGFIDTEATRLNSFKMPFLKSADFAAEKIYNGLIKSRNNHKIIIPTYKDQRGNPVLFDVSMKKLIMNIEGDSGAKKIINMYKDQTFFLETNDQSIIQDFNFQQSFY